MQYTDHYGEPMSERDFVDIVCGGNGRTARYWEMYSEDDSIFLKGRNYIRYNDHTVSCADVPFSFDYDEVEATQNDPEYRANVVRFFNVRHGMTLAVYSETLY